MSEQCESCQQQALDIRSLQANHQALYNRLADMEARLREAERKQGILIRQQSEMIHRDVFGILEGKVLHLGEQLSLHHYGEWRGREAVPRPMTGTIQGLDDMPIDVTVPEGFWE